MFPKNYYPEVYPYFPKNYIFTFSALDYIYVPVDGWLLNIFWGDETVDVGDVSVPCIGLYCFIYIGNVKIADIEQPTVRVSVGGGGGSISHRSTKQKYDFNSFKIKVQPLIIKLSINSCFVKIKQYFNDDEEVMLLLSFLDLVDNHKTPNNLLEVFLKEVLVEEEEKSIKLSGKKTDLSEDDLISLFLSALVKSS